MRQGCGRRFFYSEKFQHMLKIYCVGIIILVSAIVLNGLSNKLGITGWYDFIRSLMEKGRDTFALLRWTDYAWLLAGYPFLLGCSAKLGDFLYHWLTSRL